MANLSNINNKFLVQTGGNVGINTTSPGYKLDVTHVGADAINIGAGNDFSGIRWTGDSHAFSWRIGGDNFFLYDVTNSAQRLTITDAGNVSIGVNSPNSYVNQTTLTINGSVVGRIDLESGGTLRSSLFSLTANTTLAVDTGFFTIDVGGAERLRIDTSGNVGIGTTSPSQLLHVSSSTNNPTGIGLQNSERYYSVRSNNFSLVFTDETVGSERMRIDSSGNLLIGKTANAIGGAGVVIRNAGEIFSTRAGDVAGFNRLSSDGNIVQFYKDGSVIGAIGCNSSGGNPVLDIASSSSTSLMRFLTSNSERMRITSGGNVGIGTTSPAQKLEVVNGGFAYIRTRSTSGSFTGFDIGQHSGGSIYLNNRDNTAMVFMTNNTERMNILAGGTGTFYNAFSIQGDDKSLIVRNAAGTVIGTMGAESSSTPNVGMTTVRNNGTTTIQFNSNGSSYINGGNVGIGTTSPTQKLHVEGLALIKNNTSGLLYLYDTSNSIYGDINGDAIVTAGNSLRFTVNSSERMRIESSGYVVHKGPTGSGTNLQESWYYGTDSNFRLDLKQIVSSGLVKHSFNIVNNGVSYDNNLVLDRGNVGIGLTNPGYLIHGSNGANSRADIQLTYDALGTGNADGVQIGIQAGGAYIWNFENSDVYFATNNSRRMTIDSSGNVGINTTTPYGRLDVNGVLMVGPANEDPAVTLTETGDDVSLNNGGGSVEINVPIQGTTTSGCTLTFTYAAASWKSWVLDYEFASTSGMVKGVVGGYNNGSTGHSKTKMLEGFSTSVAVAAVGSGNQHVQVTFTFSSGMGIHPFARFIYSQGGGDGTPRADRVTVAYVEGS